MPDDRIHNQQTESSSGNSRALSPDAPERQAGASQPPQNVTKSKRRRLARFVRVYLPIIVSVIVAAEIGLQAWIYNQQRHTMNAQRAVMDEQLKTMNGQLESIREQT